MNVEAGKRALQSVLGQPDEQLRIPRFQRPYAWGSEQIDELWEDVTAISARVTSSVRSC